MCKSGDTNCEEKLDEVEDNILTIHGLWPSLQSGKILPDCNTGKYVQVREQSSYLFDQMHNHWPSFGKNSDESFWTHEYNKHGYCYNQKYGYKNYITYFRKVIEFYQDEGLKYLFQDAFPNAEDEEIETNLREIQNKIEDILPGTQYKVICKGSRSHLLLTEIYFYYDLDFQPVEVNVKQGCPYSANIYIKFK